MGDVLVDPWVPAPNPDQTHDRPCPRQRQQVTHARACPDLVTNHRPGVSQPDPHLSYIGMGEKYLDAPDFIQHAFHSFFTPPSMIECPFTVMLDVYRLALSLYRERLSSLLFRLPTGDYPQPANPQGKTNDHVIKTVTR